MRYTFIIDRKIKIKSKISKIPLGTVVVCIIIQLRWYEKQEQKQNETKPANEKGISTNGSHLIEKNDFEQNLKK